MRYALAALLVLVTVGASGQEPKPSQNKPDAVGWTAPENTGRCMLWADAKEHVYHAEGDCTFERTDLEKRIEKLEKRVAELEATVADLDKWAERSPCPKGSHFEADVMQPGILINGEGVLAGHCHDDKTGKAKP